MVCATKVDANNTLDVVGLMVTADTAIHAAIITGATMKERIEELASYLVDEQAITMLTTAVNEALELAAKQCEKTYLDWMEYSPATPSAYDCAEAIRKLKV